MDATFAWQAEHLEIILTICFVTFGFLAFHFFYVPTSPASNYLYQRYGAEEGHVRHILLRRLIGVLVYGIIPATILLTFTPYTLADYGLRFEWHPSMFYWIAGLSVVIFLLTRNTAKQAESLAMYPEIRLPVWGNGILFKSVTTWLLYFVAYELLYRGFLLFACVRAMGVWPAIVLNCAFYAITHIPKGELEAVGAIPLGFLMCIMTLQTGTIWLALFAHVTLSMMNLYFSLKYHPEIAYQASA